MSENNEAIIRRVMEEVINDGNLDVVEELFAPDYIDHNLPGDGPHREELKRHHAMIRAAFPDWRTAGEYIPAEGGRVVCRMTFSGTHRGEFIGAPPTGKSFSVQHIHVFRVTDGKISEHWAARDDLGMMRQIGVVSSPS